MTISSGGCAVPLAILFTDKDNGKLMLSSEANTLQKIWFGCGICSAVCNRHSRLFAQFTSKSYACSVKYLCGNRGRTCHRIMLVIAPMLQPIILRKTVCEPRTA